MFNKTYVEVDFGVTKIKFWPLDLLQLQELQEDINLVKQGSSMFAPDVLSRLIRLFAASAKRGNEQVTEQQVARLIDADTLGKVLRAVLGALPEGEGETTLVPTSPQIGGGSTHT